MLSLLAFLNYLSFKEGGFIGHVASYVLNLLFFTNPIMWEFLGKRNNLQDAMQLLLNVIPDLAIDDCIRLYI